MSSFKDKRFIVFFASLLLITIPFLFWPEQHMVGGDDSKLYYLFPEQYLKHYTTKIISDNALGSLGKYFPQLYIAPFVTLLLILNTLVPYLELQKLMFGFNLAGSFFFFYLLSTELYKFISEKNVRVSAISAGIFYSLSMFSYHTVWLHQLFSLYVTSLFPLLLFLFVRALRKNQNIYIVVAVLISSVFSIAIVPIPWILALFIVSLPILGFLLHRYRERFVKMVVLFAFFLFLTNIYWAAHIIVEGVGSYTPGTKSVSAPAAKALIKQNEHVILEVSKSNELVYPLFGLFHKNLQRDFNWKSYEIFINWHDKIMIFNVIFFLLPLMGLAVTKRSKSSSGNLLPLIVISWLLSLYFFTVKIGDWGTDLFLYLNRSVPGFGMFRNMFDKFGIAMSFSYALVVGASLSLLGTKIKKRSVILLALYVSAASVITAYPFIRGQYFKTTYSNSQNITPTVTDLNEDFYSLITFLKTMDTTDRFLWLPLNNANYVPIQDELDQNSYYIGVSPVYFLARKNDITGFLSLNPTTGNALRDALFRQDIREIRRLIRQINIGYVIVNKSIVPELQYTHIYSYGSGADIFKSQGGQVRDEILGEKIRDFGSRYTLYKIDPDYYRSKIYLAKSTEGTVSSKGQLTYRKENSSKYKISLKNIENSSTIMFLDPYHDKWELQTEDGEYTVFQGRHKSPFGWANAWNLDINMIRQNVPPNYIKSSPNARFNINLQLVFSPQRYIFPLNFLSAMTFLGLTIYLAFKLISKKK